MSETPHKAKLPLSCHMPERIHNGLIRYMSYPTNQRGFLDERTDKRFSKEPNPNLNPNPSSPCMWDAGYVFVDSEVSRVECSVTNYTLGEQFTSYVMRFKAYDIVWETTTRYSEMLHLVQSLSMSGLVSSDEYTAFPGRAPFVWNANEAFVKERLTQLHDFFRLMFVSHPELMRRPEVLDFARPPRDLCVELLVAGAMEQEFGTVQGMLNWWGVREAHPTEDSKRAEGIINDLARSHGWCALHHAARHGDVSLVRHLIDRHASVNIKTKSSTNSKSGVALGLEQGLGLGLRGKADCWTPLCLAASNGHHVVVQELLSCGAAPSECTSDGQSPLVLATKGQYPLVVRALLSHPDVQPDMLPQAPSEVFNGAVLAAIHIAAQLGHVFILKMLLDNGSDPNLNLDIDGAPGWLPLHWAAQGGHTACVKMLLEFNANPVALTNFRFRTAFADGNTPAEIAEMFGHEELAQILRDAENQWKERNGVAICSYEHDEGAEDDEDISTRTPSLAGFLGRRTASINSEEGKQSEKRPMKPLKQDRLTAWLMGDDVSEPTHPDSANEESKTSSP